MRVPLQAGVSFLCGQCREELSLVADNCLHYCGCGAAGVDVNREGVRLVGDVVHAYPGGLEVRPREAEAAAQELPE